VRPWRKDLEDAVVFSGQIAKAGKGFFPFRLFHGLFRRKRRFVIASHEVLPIHFFREKVRAGGVGIEPASSEAYENLVPFVNIRIADIAVKVDPPELPINEGGHLVLIEYRYALFEKFDKVEVGRAPELKHDLLPLGRYLGGLGEHHFFVLFSRALFVHYEEKTFGIHVAEFVEFLNKLLRHGLVFGSTDFKRKQVVHEKVLLSWAFSPKKKALIFAWRKRRNPFRLFREKINGMESVYDYHMFLMYFACQQGFRSSLQKIFRRIPFFRYGPSERDGRKNNFPFYPESGTLGHEFETVSRCGNIRLAAGGEQNEKKFSSPPAGDEIPGGHDFCDTGSGNLEKLVSQSMPVHCVDFLHVIDGNLADSEGPVRFLKSRKPGTEVNLSISTVSYAGNLVF